MVSQGPPNLFFGTYSSDFISSESSSVSDTDESTSGRLILEQPLIPTQVQRDSPPADNDSIQITEFGLDSSQASQDQDNGDQTLLPRLYALDLPCQTILGDSNSVLMINDFSNESSDLSVAGISSSLVMSQRSEVSQATASPNPRQANNEDSPKTCGTLFDVEQSKTTEIKVDIQHALVDFQTTGSLDPGSTQTSHPDTLCSPLCKVSQDSSALRLSPSSNHHHSLGHSHQVDAKPCEQIHLPFMESFKSSGGYSDDILSRPTLAENEDALENETSLKSRGHCESPSEISTAPLIEWRATSQLSESKALKNELHSSEHGILTDDSSPTTVGDQLEQSHEKTGVTSVSDHISISSSSSTAEIEYLQSNPYFEPAIIIRTHNPHFRTEVVGTQNLSSSSPPSSPSMSSNYVPSSSPIPTSSPVEGSSQTPSSSPVNSDPYIHTVISTGAQEDLYKDENYSEYPNYSMDRMYYKNSEQTENHDAFLPTSLQLSSPPASLSSSYSLNYYDQLTESTATSSRPEQYTQADTNRMSSSLQATSGTNQFSVEALSSPLIDNIAYPTMQGGNNHYDSTLYDAIQHTNNIQYESTPYESTQYEPIRHDNTQQDINSTVDIPQAPESRDANVIPRPKRSTLAGQRLQQKKLSKPFRSPVIHAPVRLAPKPTSAQPPIPIVTSSNSASAKDSRLTKSAASVEPIANAVASSSSQITDSKIKHRTSRASSQFKSPLSAATTPLDQATLVRLTPTIQSLERKLQLLRRALKVREDVQEEVLGGLVKKWSEAGREAAWEVWDVVKDNADSDEGRGESQDKGKKRAIEESWGWDESGDPKKPKAEGSGRNWGWDVVPVSDRAEEDASPEEEHEAVVADHQEEEEVEEGAPQPSLGTMLIQLGIAPDILGWDEDEGTFVER